MTPPVTLVLGSSQDEPAVHGGDPCGSGSGVALARRTSGGGAVLVAPGSQVWVDVWLPRDDPLWDDDILRSALWLGEAWKMGLSELSLENLEVHRGRLESSEWSDSVCFAGLGPGEVSYGGRKLVGISQRRTREGARFHTVSPLGAVGPPLRSVLELPGGRFDKLAAFLEHRSTCLADALGTGRDALGIGEDISGTDAGTSGRDESSVVESVSRSVVSAIISF